MKKISIIINDSKDENLSITKQVINKLKYNLEIYVDNKYKELINEVFYETEENLYKKCDMVLTLGGDGTLLSAARHASRYDKPVLGINLGRLGFLTGTEKDAFFEEFNLDKFKIEERMMLEAVVNRKGKDIGEYSALNDVVITRASFSRLVDIKVNINGEFLDDYTADGLVFSTPTGSTAYSLSAGGPIVDPSVEAFIITPICPHMLHARPIVLPSDKVITAEIHRINDKEAAITIDGQEGCMLLSGDIIKIKKSSTKVQLVKLHNKGFYELLRDKLQNKL